MAFFEKMMCRGCRKKFPPSELITRLCGHCWEERTTSIHQSVNDLARFKTDDAYKCMECGKRIEKAGHLVYVKDAARFALFCLDCSDRKFSTDLQYRGTPFAYTHKAQ